jgi:hypothetical protein
MVSIESSFINPYEKEIKQRYYMIMEEVFNKYKDIDERDIEHTGNILIEELVNKIMTDEVINSYDIEFVENMFKLFEGNTLNKMKYGIKHAKKDYDDKYNGMIDRMETKLLQYIKYIWKDISNNITDLYLSFDDIINCNIGKIRRDLRNYNFHYKKYNFIKYECIRQDVPDVPNAWLVYIKDTYGVPCAYINELQNEKEVIIEMYREEHKKYYNQFTETRDEHI